ncbi:hypothetical protein QUF76_11670 [Desulfobacterales bacterium HSG16]|nr:hypothetical protein [Desulfobacterales bacterium HSG16]
MNINLQGESLRKAVKWISNEKKYGRRDDVIVLASEASAKFDLSPKDSEFLRRFVLEED